MAKGIKYVKQEYGAERLKVVINIADTILYGINMTTKGNRSDL